MDEANGPDGLFPENGGAAVVNADPVVENGAAEVVLVENGLVAEENGAGLVFPPDTNGVLVLGPVGKVLVVEKGPENMLPEAGAVVAAPPKVFVMFVPLLPVVFPNRPVVCCGAVVEVAGKKEVRGVVPVPVGVLGPPEPNGTTAPEAEVRLDENGFEA